MTLKVIGVGLGRTGTLSLKLALEKLGLGPCYHMIEVFLDPSRPAQWIAAADGKPDWQAIFKGYSATTDYPACSFWRELVDYYKDAKVLLTVRDADQWFESTQATVFSPAMRARVVGTPMEPFMRKIIWRDFGERIDDRAFMTARFKQHTAEVERAIPKKRLLVYEVGQGWEPLCRFLKCPVPDTPFPHANSREEMQAMLAQAPPPGAVADPQQVQAFIRERLRKLHEQH